jgi:3-oxoacyl-[acyl-carrier-protein] synthase-3
MIRTRFVGTGRFIPERIVTNDDIAQRVDTSDEWIRARTGIRKRHVLSDGETTSDMAAEAARRACAAAGVRLDEIQCLVVATTTADMPMPSCAMLTQSKLGVRGPAFDIGAACAGFTYGTTVVDGLIRSGLYQRVLFIGAEALSRFLDWEDRNTCILFGDGAGAVVAVADEQDVPASDPRARGILSSHLDGDSSFWRDLNIPGGGTAEPPSAASVAGRRHYLRMNGRVIFSQAVLGADDVDLVIPHQANLRILEAAARRMRIPEERFIVNLDEYGNTSSASIPIALDEAVRAGRIREGMLLLHCGLGAGLTWGSIVVRW